MSSFFVGPQVFFTVVLVAFAISLLPPVCVGASSGVIYVDASNVGDPLEDGSQTHPFDQIQEAVNASSSGDTIVVTAGVYYEEVLLSKGKSDISLVAQDGTIIDGEGSRAGIRVGWKVKPEYLYNVSIIGFAVRNCVKGIDFIRCRNVHLRNNTMFDNIYNFADYSLGVNDVDTSNTVDGKPIYYWVGEHDKQIPSDAGFVALIDSRSITVRDLTLTRNGQGVLIKNSTDCRVENVTVFNNQDGVYLDVESRNNSVVGNRILECEVTGVFLSASSDNLVCDNIIAGRYYGVYLTTASGQCSGNLIVNNTVQGHWKGVVLEGYANLPVVNNVFRNNVVLNNTIGASTYLSALNLFHHNNFISNGIQVETSESQNVFDNLGQGNYWSDYDGIDENKDGVSDTPYVLDLEVRDNYPLMGLFTSNVVIWDTTSYFIETISSSSLSNLSFGQQEKTISFDLAVFSNETGFCGVNIPEVLLGGPYTVLLDDVQVAILNQRNNGTHSFQYFEYSASGGHVEIAGETVIFEFSPILLLFSLIVASALVLFLATRAGKGKPS